MCSTQLFVTAAVFVSIASCMLAAAVTPSMDNTEMSALAADLLTDEETDGYYVNINDISESSIRRPNSTSPNRLNSRRAPTKTIKDDTVGIESVRKCNGYAELCDRPLNKVAFVGTHRSHAIGFYNPATNHQKRLKTQLDDGVRVLSIELGVPITRPSYIPELSNKESLRLAKGYIDGTHTRGPLPTAEPDEVPQMCSTHCLLIDSGPLTRATAVLRHRMTLFPNDVFMIFLENRFGFYPDDLAKPFIDAGLEQLAYAQEPNKQEWPTLGELLDMGKQVVIFTTHGTDYEKYPWYVFIIVNCRRGAS